MRLITKTAELEEFCAELAAQEYAAVDTEFMRETTYWPRLCLIQAAAPNAAEAVIDPLAPELDLTPFLDLMVDARVLKVFHAARQDLEIFLKLRAALPTPSISMITPGRASGPAAARPAGRAGPGA